MTGPARRAALGALKRTAVAVDAVRPPPRGVVVLLYHRVGTGAGVEMDLAEEAFEAQMRLLAEEAWTVPLEEALSLLAAAEPPPRDPVVVTFDDGTADFVETAMPILLRYGIPATLYLATGFVEGADRLPHRGSPLSWAAVREAVSTGLVTVGSHSHGHVLLDRLPIEAVHEDLDRSVGLIGDRVGVAARHFAYPKGVLGSPRARAAVGQRFTSAALGGNRPNRYGRTDPFRLARSPVQASDTFRWFERKLAGGMGLEETVRGLANRLRYVGRRT